MDNFDIKKIRWARRRGLLEVELCVQSYITYHYHRLTKRERDALDSLLREDDENLRLWLIYEVDPPEKHREAIHDIVINRGVYE